MMKSFFFHIYEYLEVEQKVFNENMIPPWELFCLLNMLKKTLEFSLNGTEIQ